MCKICKGDTQELWPPSFDKPKLELIKSGNWVLLKECSSCHQLWVESPYEPYASFVYLVKWNNSIEDWQNLHNKDDGKTLCNWMTYEIRRLYKSCIEDIQKSIINHNQRSYGHYSLTQSVDTNPIKILS